MNRSVNTFLLIFLLILGLKVWAQQKAGNKAGNKPADHAVKAHKALLLPGVYFGNTGLAGGVYPKKEFDDLLKKGFTAHDSVGNKYQIVGFDFTYAERNLYEDSIGNLEVLVDYMNEYCVGDTISSGISGSIYERIKEGDTVYIDHVTLLKNPGNTLLSANDTSELLGKGLKCVIVK